MSSSASIRAKLLLAAKTVAGIATQVTKKLSAARAADVAGRDRTVPAGGARGRSCPWLAGARRHTGWRLTLGRHARLGTVRQPHIEHRMLYRVEARAVGEHPAAEDALLLAVELQLFHLDESRGFWRLGWGPRVANPWRHLQSAECGGLVERNLEAGNFRRHLVERGEDGDRVLDALGRRRRGQQRSHDTARAGGEGADRPEFAALMQRARHAGAVILPADKGRSIERARETWHRRGRDRL